MMRHAVALCPLQVGEALSPYHTRKQWSGTWLACPPLQRRSVLSTQSLKRSMARCTVKTRIGWASKTSWRHADAVRSISQLSVLAIDERTNAKLSTHRRACVRMRCYAWQMQANNYQRAVPLLRCCLVPEARQKRARTPCKKWEWALFWLRIEQSRVLRHWHKSLDLPTPRSVARLARPLPSTLPIQPTRTRWMRRLSLRRRSTLMAYSVAGCPHRCGSVSGAAWAAGLRGLHAAGLHWLRVGCRSRGCSRGAQTYVLRGVYRHVVCWPMMMLSCRVL
eukprot:COSAG01_NODE_950_length_12503_cov_39.622057_6_plen_278_part_00